MNTRSGLRAIRGWWRHRRRGRGASGGYAEVKVDAVLEHLARERAPTDTPRPSRQAADVHVAHPRPAVGARRERGENRTEFVGNPELTSSGPMGGRRPSVAGWTTGRPSRPRRGPNGASRTLVRACRDRTSTFRRCGTSPQAASMSNARSVRRGPPPRKWPFLASRRDEGEGRAEAMPAASAGRRTGRAVMVVTHADASVSAHHPQAVSASSSPAAGPSAGRTAHRRPSDSATTAPDSVENHASSPNRSAMIWRETSASISR